MAKEFAQQESLDLPREASRERDSICSSPCCPAGRTQGLDERVVDGGAKHVGGSEQISGYVKKTPITQNNNKSDSKSFPEIR